MKKNFWLVSDTHFGHKELVKYVRKDYKTPDEMNEQIIKDWNEVIGPNDVVIHLGDFALDISQSEMKDIVSRLNGKKVMIAGNHEKKNIESNRHFYNKVGFDETESEREFLAVGKLMLSHEPVLIIPDGSFNIHGHYHVGGLRDLLNHSEDRLNICMTNRLKPLLIEEEWIKGDFTTLKKVKKTTIF